MYTAEHPQGLCGTWIEGLARVLGSSLGLKTDILQECCSSAGQLTFFVLNYICMSSVEHNALVAGIRSAIITFILQGIRSIHSLLHHHPVLMPHVAHALAADAVLVYGHVGPHPLLEPDAPPGGW